MLASISYNIFKAFFEKEVTSFLLNISKNCNYDNIEDNRLYSLGGKIEV